MKMNKSATSVALLTLSALALSGCGKGGQIVKDLKFAMGDENGHLVAGFDAKVSLGSGSLPEVKLPIYDPNSPARFLGYIETHYDGGVTVRVDVTEAAHVKTENGTKLPNGREIPIVLPQGVVPLAIPVINSNSKVYLAVGEQNIMAGAAITLVADTATGGSDWLRILQSLPANIFYPFQFSPDTRGTAGIFTGEKIGVGVFAVKTLGTSAPAPSFAATDFTGKGLTASRERAPAAKKEVFGLKTQYPTGRKASKIGRALSKVRRTQLN